MKEKNNPNPNNPENPNNLTKFQRLKLHLHNFWLDIKIFKYGIDYKIWDFIGNHAELLSKILTTLVMIGIMTVILVCLNFMVMSIVYLVVGLNNL